MIDRITTAESDKCRRPTLIENIGTAIGKVLADTPVRPWLRAVFHGVLNLQTGGRGLTYSLPDGETVRILPAYRYVSWNLDEYNAFKKTLGPGSIALDIGANVGCYSLLFGQWTGLDGKVFAFEPVPETFLGLSRHIELNALCAVVIPVQAAVCDSSAAAASFFVSDIKGISRLAVREDETPLSRVVQVPTITVDEFCAREKVLPDFIKIDVEGFELAVLRGARETIKARGKKLALFMEIHPTTWRRIGLSKEHVVAELELQGLTAMPLGPFDDMWAVEGVCMRILAK